MKDEKIRKKLAYYKTQRKKGKTDAEIFKMWNAKLDKEVADIAAIEAKKVADAAAIVAAKKAIEDAAKKVKEEAELASIASEIAASAVIEGAVINEVEVVNASPMIEPMVEPVVEPIIEPTVVIAVEPVITSEVPGIVDENAVQNAVPIV